MESIWESGAKRKKFDALSGEVKTDVLIIGGGIAGILCGYMLKKAGVNCILVEADRILAGVTGYTTAKITLQHGLIYDKIISKYGFEAAKMYLSAQQTALDYYKELCGNIECDYKTQEAYVYSLNNPKKIENEAAAYEKLGVDFCFREKLDLPVDISCALGIKNQAQFNPLKFCFTLSEHIPVYEKTKVLEINKGGVITNRGKIFAEKIIIATHFPILKFRGGYFLKMYQHRSYVLALENAPIPKGMYVDENNKGLSFREYNGKLILGGGSHRTGKKGGNWQELREFAKKYYPESREILHWATQDCMSLDSMPYIGRASKGIADIYVTTGFNKWGMTSSMVSALVLRDMITGKENKFAEVFSPSRSIFHTELIKNVLESTVNLLTPTVPRCPHLGCALKYNQQEHTWDCPCHGSRFTEKGELIENPALHDKNI